MEVHERIRILRKDLKMSVETFGAKLGVSRSVINNIERGVLARPEQKLPLIRLMCNVFGVNEAWILTGEGEMYQENQSAFFDKMETHYHLTKLERKAIEMFVELPEEDRAAIMRYVEGLVAEYAQTQQKPEEPPPVMAADKNPSDWTEDDIDALIEQTRRELLEAREQAAKSRASPKAG